MPLLPGYKGCRYRIKLADDFLDMHCITEKIVENPFLKYSKTTAVSLDLIVANQ